MKQDKVYSHFNNTDQYLRRRFDIDVRAEIVKELVGNPENVEIIDIGCGDGSISLQFQSEDNHLTLVDISENMLERAKNNILHEYSDRVELILGDANAFSAENRFDIVLGIGLLAHVDSILQTVESLSKILKPGGYCILQITDDAQLFSKFLHMYNGVLDKITGQFGYHRNKLNFSGLISIAQRYHLEYIMSQQYSLVLPGFVSLLPDKIMYKYHNFVRRNNFLSSCGSDFMIKFQKSDC